ncbi:MAG: triose-phosphate isomerase [archaeon]
MQPFLFLNFKTYKEATGKNAVKLARIAQAVSRKTGVKIVLVVQAVDLRLISKGVSLPVFAQHADHEKPGASTGRILPFALKDAGCRGVVLNHAENKRGNGFVGKAIAESKAVGLQVLVCAESEARAVELARFAPDFIAVEPSELIGGNVSVSTAKPGLIVSSVKKIGEISGKIKIITGAGVKSGEDARLAVKLGTVGIFVASGVVLAKNRAKALSVLAVGLKEGLH